VLVGGAAVFGYANYIARFTLSPPQTAAAQYDRAIAAEKMLSEQLAALGRQIKEIINEDDVSGPRIEEIRQIKEKSMVLEDDILLHCGKHKFDKIDFYSDFGFQHLQVTPSPYSNWYILMLPSDRVVSFESLSLANDCHNHFAEHETEITQNYTKMANIRLEISKILNGNRYNKSEELKPINQQISQVSVEQREINDTIKILKTRMTQEKYLGIPMPLENLPKDNADAKIEKIDWPHVIETNATRIGVLAAMFFLVTILVPQYRYSIKMANFYRARYDGLEMLPEKMSAEDFDKIVNIMTPDIDFGKSPPTPWQHILEVMKAAKS
jgi:hypothetical protein